LRTLERISVTTHPKSRAKDRFRWFYSKVSQRAAIFGLQKSHAAADFFGENVAMLRPGIATMNRPASRMSS
jgi:hypothetical protein